MHLTGWLALVGFAVAASFTIAAAIIESIRTDSLPAKIYCDLASQYLSTGRLATPPNATLAECGPPMYQRWYFVGMAWAFFLGAMFMYAERNSSYGQAFQQKYVVPLSDPEQGELKGVLQPSGSKRKEASKERKPSLLCCGCFDGFFIVHLFVVPALWVVFCLCQGSSTFSWIFGTVLFQAVSGYTKVLSVLDRHASYAVVSKDTFAVYLTLDVLYVAWWGFAVLRSYIYDTERASGLLVAWWVLVLVYTLFVGVCLIFIRVLKDDSLINRPIASATMQETRIYIACTDALYLCITGALLFAFVY